MQTDIGFGDVMTQGPDTLTYPTILGFPAPMLSVYSRETVVPRSYRLSCNSVC
jgi:hypothetical protein